jgi:hypothetical protein
VVDAVNGEQLGLYFAKEQKTSGGASISGQNFFSLKTKNSF